MAYQTRCRRYFHAMLHFGVVQFIQGILKFPSFFSKKSITLPVATTSFWLTSWSIGRNVGLFWLSSPVTGPMVIIAPMNVMRDRMS